MFLVSASTGPALLIPPLGLPFVGLLDFVEGGLSPNDSTKIDIIQFLSFATGGQTTDFGNLAAATQECASTTNAHGGLGLWEY